MFCDLFDLVGSYLEAALEAVVEMGGKVAKWSKLRFSF
jgi:hypothetical protein